MSLKFWLGICVLSFLLKVSIESHFLISKGILFHNRGAQTEKARESYVLRLNLGSCRILTYALEHRLLIIHFNN